MILTRTWIARLPLDVIYDVASEQSIPWPLLAAIVQTESGGNKNAARFEPDYKYLVVPDKYAREQGISQLTELMFQKTSWGLAQIMGGVAREHGFQGSLIELVEPELNLTLACKHIQKLSNRWKDRADFIAAYNAGSPVKQLDGKYKNQQYVDKVLNYMAALTETFDYKKV
jgi:hypothetical protein